MTTYLHVIEKEEETLNLLQRMKMEILWLMHALTIADKLEIEDPKTYKDIQIDQIMYLLLYVDDCIWIFKCNQRIEGETEWWV